MPKGDLIVCPTCGFTFERHERGASAVDCPRCRAGSDGHASAVITGHSASIVCRFSPAGRQWVAFLDCAPQVAYGGDVPMAAVRRFLEGSEQAPGTYPLVCDANQVGSALLHRELVWQPPEILFECSACQGTGKYVGLVDVDTCRVCGGRKLVRA